MGHSEKSKNVTKKSSLKNRHTWNYFLGEAYKKEWIIKEKEQIIRWDISLIEQMFNRIDDEMKGL